METTVAQSGSIFILRDNKKATTESSKQYDHDYLVIGKHSNERLGQWQCMCITSMLNKEIEWEVPVVLCNNMVSYIVPYNVHSFVDSDFSVNKYRGCLSPTSIMSTYDFMCLLIDIWADCSGFGLADHNSVVERYNKYCSDFWATYSDLKEYRETKATPLTSGKSIPQTTPKRNAVTHQKVTSVYHKPVRKQTIERFDEHKALANAITQSSLAISDDGSVSIDNTAPHAELVYSEDAEFSNTVQIPDSVMINVPPDENDTLLGPSHLGTILGKYKFGPKSWNDDDLIQWNKITTKYKHVDCRKFCNNITSGAFSSRCTIVETELRRRNLPVITRKKVQQNDKPRVNNDFSIRSHIKNWTDKEVMSVYMLYYSMDIKDFCAKFKCTPQSIPGRITTVKREAISRGLLKEADVIKRRTPVTTTIPEPAKVPALL